MLLVPLQKNYHYTDQTSSIRLIPLWIFLYVSDKIQLNGKKSLFTLFLRPYFLAQTLFNKYAALAF